MENIALRNLSRLYTYSANFRAVEDRRQWAVFKNIIKSWAGQDILIIVEWNGVEVQRTELSVPGDLSTAQFNEWFELNYIMGILEKDISGDYYPSPENNEDRNTDTEFKMRIFPISMASPQAISQAFLDGKISHCVLDPMLEWAEAKKEEIKDNKNKNTYNGVIKLLNKYKEEYKSGIPQDKLGEVARATGFNINIFLPSIKGGMKDWMSFKGQKGKIQFTKSFNYINGRWNHLEVLLNTGNIQELEREQFNKVKETMDSTDTFYSYNSNKTKIFTATGGYAIVDQYQEAMKEFETKNKLNYYRMDILGDDPSQFILHALRVNGTYDFQPIVLWGGGTPQDDDEDNKQDSYDVKIKGEWHHINTLLNTEKGRKILKTHWKVKRKSLTHIDQEKAYTNYDKTKYYKGLVGKLWEFRQTDKIVELGFYRVKNVRIDNPLIKEMRLLEDNNVYFSPELEYYKDNGCNFDIDLGCWGSRIDLEWTPGMFNKNERGLKNYAKWFGCEISMKSKSSLYFDTNDENYIKNLSRAYLHTDETIGYLENCDSDGNTKPGEKKYQVRIQQPRKAIYHHAQICAGISSYQRIIMLEQLSKFNHKQLVRICVDGIYFTGQTPELIETFREKKEINLGNNGGLFRSPKSHNQRIQDYPEAREYNGQHEIHIGAGGCGKTHKNLIDTGLIKPLYVAHSWKLCAAKKEEYSLKGSIPNQRLTFDAKSQGKCYIQQYNESFNTLIIDEISTMTKQTEDKIMKLYPGMKIIWCGDINEQGKPYQCPPFSSGALPFEIKENFSVIKHYNNRRCECPILLDILTLLRRAIDDNLLMLKKDDVEKNIINKYKINYTDDTLGEVDYCREDLILNRTHRRCYVFDEKYKDLEKYKVICGDNDKILTSQILLEKPEGGKFIEGIGEKVKKSKSVGGYCIKHGFTIDSIQGETAKTKLFIDLEKSISTQHLYTALSRAKTINQINFIGLIK